MEEQIAKIEAATRQLRKMHSQCEKQGMVRRCALLIGVHGTVGCYTDAQNLKGYAQEMFDRVICLSSAKDTTANNIHSAIESCQKSCKFLWVHFSGYANTGSDNQQVYLTEYLSAFPRICLLSVDCLRWSPPRHLARYHYGSTGNVRREFVRGHQNNTVLCLYSSPSKKVCPQYRRKGKGLTSALLRALDEGKGTILGVLEAIQRYTGHPAFLSAAGKLRPEPRRAAWIW